jgi:glycosyltransferase involved in cell wall biosynthesis
LQILIPAIIDIQKTAPNRLHQFIKELSKKHKITVVCINDFWKAGQVDTGRHYQDFDEILKNIDIMYFTQKKTSPIMQEVFSPLFLRNIPNNGYDVIFNYNTLISGTYLAQKFNIPMVYDIADDLPAMIGDSPQIPTGLGGIGRWFGEKMVEKTIQHSAKVCAISDIFRTDHSIPEDKFQVVPNGVDTTLFRKVESSIREDLKIKSHFVLGYVGVLREWVDLAPVYQVLPKLDNTKLLVVGQEGLYEENRKMVKDLGIEDKVIFTGNVPYADVPKYIAAMDVCLIPFKDNAISHNAVPLKLFEYMACEKPVISTNLEGVRNAVGDRIFYCDQAEDYYQTIQKFKKDGSPVNSLQINRKYVEEHSEWSAIGKSVEQILGEIA